MSHPAPGIPEADLDIAHPARIYGYWLGGSDYGPADQAVAEEVARRRPEVVAGARANRAFARRATWYAANGCGISQFLDVGAGLPAPGATSETARQACRGCRVVYADSDPGVVERARCQVIAGSGCIADYICADVRAPASLLDAASGVLDFTEPVAVLLLAVLHFVPAADNPAGLVADLAAALAPGSLIMISHLTDDFAPCPVAAADAYNALVPTAAHPRSEAEVTAMFGGLSLRYPGVVAVNRWRPSFRRPLQGRADLYAGVAVLPPAGAGGP